MSTKCTECGAELTYFDEFEETCPAGPDRLPGSHAVDPKGFFSLIERRPEKLEGEKNG